MKFFIVLFIALAVCDFATAQSNMVIQNVGVQDLPLFPIQWDPNDQQLVGLLDSSLQHIIPAAISAGKISAGNWTLSKVNSVGEMNDTEYQFNVEISDGNGNTANLIVEVVLGPGEKVKFANYSVLKS